MRSDVEEYEQTILYQAVIVEQVRVYETQSLNNKAKSLKNK